MDWASFWIGVATPFAVGVALMFLAWLASLVFGRTTGSGGCTVCDHMPSWEIGAHSNLYRHFQNVRHDLLWGRRRWHREAWRFSRMNPLWSDGSHDRLQWYSVECSECPGLPQFNAPPSAWASVAGGSFALSRVAEAVAFYHEKAKHKRAKTTRITALAPRAKKG